MYEILIVGGGPGRSDGSNVCCRAGKHVAVLERGSTGGQIISAPLVENYPGIPSVSGTELARQMTEQACTFGAEIVYTEAVGLEKTPAGFRVLCMDGVREAKAVILATGAAHRSLGLAAEDALTGCGVSYCAVCDGAFYEGLDVAVVGGGDTALQDTLFLANICRSVTLIHRREAFRASAMLVGRAEKQENIRLLRSPDGAEAHPLRRRFAGCGAFAHRNWPDGAPQCGRPVHRSRSGPAECSFSGSRCGRERVLSGGRGYKNKPAWRLCSRRRTQKAGASAHNRCFGWCSSRACGVPLSGGAGSIRMMQHTGPEQPPRVR